MFRSMEGHCKQHCAVRTDLYDVPDTFRFGAYPVLSTVENLEHEGQEKHIWVIYE
jgi:hypothetical protein